MSPFDSNNEDDLMRIEDFQSMEDHEDFNPSDVDNVQDHHSKSENEAEEEQEELTQDYSNELNSSSIFNFNNLNSSSGSFSSSINHEMINIGLIEEVVEEDPVLFSTPYQPFWRRWESMFRTLSSGSR
ncbi:uncharacterized protein MELLADRAFT_71689 [Melampsora larici-populina 98AG31]|uniref:Uncharacterized protein n=1 Tax=Melampsora larici-populina (strain 98AG31 / pathotype 3-4-7) TaxID=747676 RepID=F4RJI3_MELLP|nr:uncharacterized protein MELLADRAFT_71689 [Melampsora larici-populina 98AG31]EGG07487.1 hypothetical protein MELLADRAFT_71689 [Melampsora larici-populina 98AG31]